MTVAALLRQEAYVLAHTGDDVARLALADAYRECGFPAVADELASPFGPSLVLFAALNRKSVCGMLLSIEEMAGAAVNCWRTDHDRLRDNG